MARGSNTLFSKIFNCEKKEQPLRKGRSSYFNSKRNELLIDRYYYLAKLSGKRYDLLLERLSNEFFLSTATIPEIIDSNYQYLIDLKKQQPSESYFKKKWPHFNWIVTN